MQTVNEMISEQMRQFRRLSQSRQRALARQARNYIRKYPHMADANGFWRGLSARHVLSAWGREPSNR